MSVRLEETTPYSLAELSEEEFEQAEVVLEFHVQRGEDRAAWLLNCVDTVVDQFGTYELAFLQAMDDCPFTQAHTRHWCGRLFCRDS